MIGRKAEEVLNRAVRFAFDFEHEYFTVEHVFLSLLEEEEVRSCLRACGAEPDALRKDLEGYLRREVPKVKRAIPQDAEPESGAVEVPEAPQGQPVATLGVQRLIQRAVFQVQSSGNEEIRPRDLLVALFQSKDSYSLHLLSKYRVERLDVLSYISHGGKEEADEKSLVEAGAPEGEKKEGSAGDALRAFTVNLNDLAREGKIDPLIGRAHELERMVQTLCRRRKNNPLLVGEAGVGKTALAEGLALRIVSGDVPPFLAEAEVYSLDMGSLLAGSKYRGDFEQRIKRVLKGLMDRKDKGKEPILLIDEIHTIVGAGSVSGGHVDAANLIKPVLSRGEIRFIGSTTYKEYRNSIEKDHALARRFQKIDVPEPSVEETVKILEGLKTRFEEHHHVTYTGPALRAAAELSAKHLTDRFLPDKAIDVIDEVGAKTRLARQRAGSSEEKAVIDERAVEEAVAQIARIPARSVSTSQKKRLKDLERDLKLVIFGQDHAIGELVTAIRLARSGLRTGERPVGSFLFCGPTGVGKTELAKQMARCLGVQFLRFDMSEYMEKHTVSRLIGAPPGYVGFEQQGLLTDAALKHPHSVILLDEFEKAHPDVWNILLQVMDHGTLTDNNGRKADFRNSVIIMTSNVGSRDHDKRPLGMGPSAQTGSVSKQSVEQAFSPEFRNRLDAIVYFNPLDPATVSQIVGKQLVELETQLLARGVELDVGDDVRDWLAKKGYDRLMGARPMARLIQERLKRPLSEEILFGALEKGGIARARVEGDGLVFEYAAAKKRRRGSGPGEGGEGGSPEGSAGDEGGAEGGEGGTSRGAKGAQRRSKRRKAETVE